MATEALLPDESSLATLEDDSLKISILGFGTVGRAVAGILNGGDIAGLGLAHIFNRNIASKRVNWTNPEVLWTEDIQEILASDTDVIVETIGGLEPAGEWVRQALRSGKSVVTANKQLIARYGPDLAEIANENGCQLLFGASVAGGVPVIAALEQGLAGDRIESLCGILNGTCNYILSKMESGVAYHDALKEAQALGYAEADPTDDVEGYDTRAKVVILARIALGADISLENVQCRSISNVGPVDFEYAREIKATIRQIGQAELRDGGSFVTVEPMLVPQGSPLARAQACENVVIASGKFGGKTVFSGAGAGGNATAVAVVSDLLALAQRRPFPGPRRGPRLLHAAADCVAPYYLRFVVQDRPGIVAKIAATLAKFEINVDAVFQKPGYDKSRLPFVITVEPCSTAKLDSAVEEISQFDFLVESPLRLRIFEV